METWKDIEGFPGYQVSDRGRIRTYWKRKHYPTGYGSYNYISDTPTIMKQSDDGNGYLKVMLYRKGDEKRYCKKTHRLVAEAFIPHKPEDDTVDHIESGIIGKNNNSVDNLRWVSRAENIKKAYHDGMCDSRIKRQNKSIFAIDLWTDEEIYFDSIKDAARELGIDRSSISHVLLGDYEKTGHYRFEYADREDVLLYGQHEYY